MKNFLNEELQKDSGTKPLSAEEQLRMERLFKVCSSQRAWMVHPHSIETASRV